MDQGTLLANQDKQSSNSCMPQSALTCSILLPGIIKVFLTVAVMQRKQIVDAGRANCPTAS